MNKCFFFDEKSTFQGTDGQPFFFSGVVNNLQELFEDSKNTTQSELLFRAISCWDVNVNQHLQGDYILAWTQDENIIITSSARSSHSLYWTESNGLSIATDLVSLIKLTEHNINESMFLSRLVFGLILNSNTSFEHIQQLLPGETIKWQLKPNLQLLQRELMSASEQRRMTQELSYPEGIFLKSGGYSEIDTSKTKSSKTGSKKIESSKIFQQIPQLATRLGVPIVDASLVEFSERLIESDTKYILLDDCWLMARYQVDVNELAKSYRWCPILKQRLAKHRYLLGTNLKELKLEFKNENDELKHELSFSQWFDLSYVLPAWYRLLQNIAILYGKTLICPQVNYVVAKQLVTQSRIDDLSGYFKLTDISICNVFDAMQRLLYDGESITKTLFNVAPPVTAKLVRKIKSAPRRTEQICIQLLTFNYLSRFG